MENGLPEQCRVGSGSVSAASIATRSLLLFLSFSFYKSNYVQKFHYSRPVRKGTVDPENEFAVSISPTLDPKPNEVKLTAINMMTLIPQSYPMGLFSPFYAILSLPPFKM